MELISAGGLKLAVTDIGSGAPILFCHSFPLDSTLYAVQMDALASEKRLIAVDFPGLGQSPPAAGGEPVTFELFAKALREVLAKRRIPRIDGVGLSMGSFMLLELARQAPLLIHRLVLASGWAGPPSPEAKAERESMAQRIEREGTGWLEESFAPKLLKPTPERATLRLVKQIVRRASTPGAAGAARAIASRRDQTETARALTGKTLVLQGGEDQILHGTEGEAMAQLIPHGRFESIPGAGHLVNLDEPEYFTRALVSLFED